MNIDTIKPFAGRKAVKALVVVIFLWQVLAIVEEAGSDFANDILFYLAAETNPYVVGFFILLLVSTYLLGRRAGVEMLLATSGYMRTGVKYALITTVIALAYLLVVGVRLVGWHATWEALSWKCLVIFFSMLIVWLLASRRVYQEIKLQGQDPSVS
ncbi:hypothetical protein ACDQ55_15450 [Chitinophaga sp. 30R24]|uniref:hypothetical protein n=1 Tax=Chitinophaga sp. 30R24 TaxID=3248838 RepID=UPI003B90B2C2